MKKILFLLLLAPLAALGQSISQKADELVTAYTQQHKFSGNVLIAKQGKVIFQKSYGYADLVNKKLNTTQTQFRAGSLTKMFTSTLILQLVEAGKLSLTDSVAKFVPGFVNGENIQIRHLLSHTSGIRSAAGLPEMADLSDAVARFTPTTPAFKPGEQFDYQNFNYILLSYIAEKTSGKPFPVLIQENVLQRVGMSHSGLDYTERTSEHKALGYVTDPESGNWQRMEARNVAAASGAGALYTTTDDLLKWANALSSHALLPAAAYQLAFTPVQGNYGLGWIINRHNGRVQVGHTGSIEGFIATFLYYPEEEITLAVLSNYRDTDGRQLTQDLTAVIFDEPYQLPVAKHAIQLSASEMNKYVGQYKLNEHFTLNVLLENNKLLALAPGDEQKVELVPESPTKFFLKGPQTEVEFVEENGKVQYMFINMQGGQKLLKVN